MSRKNIKPPVDPIPEVYKVQQDYQGQETSKLPVDVPIATLHGSKNNLKKIKSFKTLRQSYKVNNQQAIFISDMKQMLDHLDTTENKFNLELLVEVSNIANEFFIYGKKEIRESSKMEAVNELLLPYFQDDNDILETMLKSVQNKITSSNAFRRGFRRLYNFFCMIRRA